MKYKIIVKTGDQPDAGTSSTLNLKIIGSEGETQHHKLNRIFQNELKQGSLNKFTILDKDIGEIECLDLHVYSLVSSIEHTWYLDYIVIVKDTLFQESFKFLFYQWITTIHHDKPIIIATNRTCIQNKDTSARNSNSRRELQVNTSVNWRHYDEFGGPNFIEVYGGHDNLKDRNLRFSFEKKTRFEESLENVKRNGIWVGILSKLQSFESLDDFKKFSRDLKNHASYLSDDKWRKDEEFGRQILNGVNPAHLRRCRKLPDNFPVTNSLVEGILNRGKSLEEEMDDGNVYIINHKILEDIPTGFLYNKPLETKDGKIQLAIPMCLFYVRTDGKLVPIAIQLGQRPGPNHPIWTPNDATLDWILVKIWFLNSHMMVHQMGSHLAYTHFMIEPFAIALHRRLPPVHPVHKLLREHLQFVIGINTLGRDILVATVIFNNFYRTSCFTILRLLECIG